MKAKEDNFESEDIFSGLLENFSTKMGKPYLLSNFNIDEFVFDEQSGGSLTIHSRPLVKCAYQKYNFLIS